MKTYFQFLSLNLAILFFAFNVGLAYAGYPPTTSKGSADSADQVTFKYQFPNFTGTHSGTTFSLGVNSVSGGGTGLSTLTANGLMVGNGTSAPTFVAPGTSGNVLQSNGTAWVSTALSNSTYLPKTLQKFTSGSGTYYPSYVFLVSSANATVGATYSNNSVTYTVSQTISAGTILVMTAPSMADPTGSTLTKVTGTGDATITFSAFNHKPLQIHVQMVGGGAGGGGSGTNATGGGGTSGGNTTFGTSLLTANGGGGGGGAGQGGSGGAATIGAGAIGFSFSGGLGGQGAYNNGAAQAMFGPPGASSVFGGAGTGPRGSAGGAAQANTGSGGSGGPTTGNGVDYQGGGGGAGAYIDALISGTYITANYSTGVPYAIGSGGGGGSAGTSGFAGGSGAAGVAIVTEAFQ